MVVAIATNQFEFSQTKTMNRLSSFLLPGWMLMALMTACSPRFVRPSLTEAQQAQAVQAFNHGVSELTKKQIDYSKAIHHFQTAVQTNPYLFEAHLNLGLLYQHGNQLAQAEASFLKALAVRPDAREVTFSLSDVLQRQKKPQAAFRLLSDFIQENPNDLVARNNLANLYRLQGNHEKAFQEIQTVLKLDPTDLPAHNHLAIFFSEQGKPAMAESVFRRLLEIDPDNPTILSNHGLTKLSHGQVQEALQLFLRAFKQKPELFEAGLNAASIYMASGDYEKAQKLYQQIERSRPGVLEALLGLAISYRFQKEFKKAQEVYERLLRLDPTHPQAMFNLGILYLKFIDKPSWACEAFLRYLDLAQKDPLLDKKATEYLEDIRLANPKACQKGKEVKK